MLTKSKFLKRIVVWKNKTQVSNINTFTTRVGSRAVVVSYEINSSNLSHILENLRKLFSKISEMSEN